MENLDKAVMTVMTSHITDNNYMNRYLDFISGYNMEVAYWRNR